MVRRKAGDAGEAIKEFLSLPQEQTDGRESAQALTTAIRCGKARVRSSSTGCTRRDGVRQPQACFVGC